MSKFEYLTLNNGTKIPPFGFGTYKLENIPNKIKFALENGYRLIDTAKIYKNEEEVGKGINEYLSSHKEIKREDSQPEINKPADKNVFRFGAYFIYKITYIITLYNRFIINIFFNI